MRVVERESVEKCVEETEGLQHSNCGRRKLHLPVGDFTLCMSLINRAVISNGIRVRITRQLLEREIPTKQFCTRVTLGCDRQQERGTRESVSIFSNLPCRDGA